jgi:Lsr2
MAQRQVTVFIDDVTGEELEDGETVTFGVDGVEYEIDLSQENAEQLREALAPYVEHGRRVGGRSTRAGRSDRQSSRRSRQSDSSPRKGEGAPRDTRAIREWARSEGYEVSERGRIPASVIEAYDNAH